MTPSEKRSFITLYCEYIQSKAYPKYIKEVCGNCARFVREAVEFALVTKNLKRVLSAKNYGPSYEEVGFKKIFSYPAEAKAKYKPILGDIAIIQYEPHGHIAIYTNKGWISDFYQIDMYGGSIRKENPPFQIYRV